MSHITPLISANEIAEAVGLLGQKISEDFSDSKLTVLGVLTGSIVLVTDLMRQIELPHQLGLVQASSYRGKATTPGELCINLDFLPDIKGRDILLVDDIFDTGRTLSTITEKLQQFQPNRIRSAVLLWKKTRSQVELTPDYYCFEIPDKFVVGYGLDYNGEHRHLPYIGVINTDE